MVWCCAVQGVELDLEKQVGWREEMLKGGGRGTLEKNNKDGENKRDGLGCRWTYERKI